MSKYINITVSTSLSTDFILEVPDDLNDEVKIRELAEREVVLPHNYPSYINNFLRTRMGINVQGIDSMLNSWNIDELTYLIDGRDNSITKRE